METKISRLRYPGLAFVIVAALILLAFGWLRLLLANVDGAAAATADPGPTGEPGRPEALVQFIEIDQLPLCGAKGDRTDIVLDLVRELLQYHQ